MALVRVRFALTFRALALFTCAITLAVEVIDTRSARAAINGSGAVSPSPNDADPWDTSNQQLVVGSSAQGLLNINNGSDVINGSVNSLVIALTQSASGSALTVTDTGSTLSSSSGIFVGYNGTGFFNLTNGATATMDSASIAYAPSASGSKVTIGGGNGSSTWTNAGLSVGENGAGTLNISGGGSVATTAANNAYVGYGNSSNGTVNVGDNTAAADWAIASDLYVGYLGAGTLNVNGGGVVAGAKVTNGNAYLGFESTADATATVKGIGSEWSSTGGLSVGVSGKGTLNIESGGLVSAASLNGGNANSSIVFNNGTLRITATDSASNAINLLAGGGTIDTPAAGVTFTISSPISGAGSLTKTGAGTLRLDASNTYTGATSVSAGMLRLGASERIANTSAITVASGATFNLNGNSEIIGSLAGSGNVTNVGALITGNDTSTAFSGVISGSGSLTKVGSGTMTLSNTNSYTGGTNLNGGTLTASVSGALGPSGTISFNGGTLQYSGSNNTDYSSRFSNAAGQAYRIGTTTQSVTFNTALTSTGGSLTKLDAGVLILNGTNTYSGGTIVSAGALQGSTSSIQGVVTNNAAVVFDQNFNGAYSSAMSGTGSLTKRGNGTLTLTGGNSYGSTIVTAGTLSITDGGSVSNLLARIGDTSGSNGTVSVGGGTGSSSWTNGSFTVGISGTGTLNITGGGSVSSTNSSIGTVAAGNGIVSVGGGSGTSSWTNSGQLAVGSSGPGSLNVIVGGTVSNTTGFIGYQNGGNGTVNIGGTGTSTWTNSEILYVGYVGTGALTITGGGSVSNTQGIIGRLSSSKGSVTVGGGTGVSHWTNSAAVYVGHDGPGTLTVTGGGSVSNSVGIIGYKPGSTGEATVTGPNSHWTNSSTLYIGGDFNGSGGTGSLSISNGGQVTAPTIKIWSTGKLAGNGGTLSGIVTNRGTIAPGNSAGVLTINGDLTQETTGKLQIELGGTAASTYDKLNVNGALALGGTLEVLIDGFSPLSGQSFDILDWTTLSGSFSQLLLPTVGPLVWDSSQLYTFGVLSVFLPGDFNFDSKVDAADYVVLRKGLGTVYTPSHYDQWRANFGKSVPATASLAPTTAVPEPASLLLVLATASAILLARYRPRRGRYPGQARCLLAG